MNDVELLAEWVQDLAHEVRNEIATLSLEELTWQPDARGNSIGVTVWHFSRWLDFLLVRGFLNQPAEAEQWHTRGWREKTGYDPRGIGYEGWGALTGYTWDEVEAIPTLLANDLLTYLDQSAAAMHDFILTLSTERLHQPIAGLGGGGPMYTPRFGGTTGTAYQWLKMVIKGSQRHLGEIQAFKAMQARARQESRAVQN